MKQVAWFFIVLLPLAAHAQTHLPLVSIVEPGVVSTDAIDTELSYSPDGTTRLLSRSSGTWGENGKGTIYESTLTDDTWSPFTVAPCSGTFSDSDPFYSPDGQYVYFTSVRDSTHGGSGGRDIWRVSVSDNDYGEPEPLAEPRGLGYTYSIERYHDHRPL